MSDARTYEPGARVLVTAVGKPFEAEVISATDRDALVRRLDTGKRIGVKISRCRPAERAHVTPAAPSPEVMGRVRTSRPVEAAEPQPKDPPRENRSYLDFVRRKPCCNCGSAAPSDPHHWGLKGRTGGMGLKADDQRTVPLCRRCHDCFHDHRYLPGRTTEQTVTHLLAVQVELLLEWSRGLTAALALQIAEARR